MNLISRIQTALTEEAKKTGVSAWIFTNFSHRDTLTDSFLSLDTETVSTRRWVYIIPSQGECIKIVHAIEKNILDNLPGEVFSYASRDELSTLLSNYSEKTFAAFLDPAITVISTMEAGFADFLRACNITLISAAPLIQRTRGLLTKAGIESQERSGSLLYQTVQRAWEFISAHYHDARPLYESAVQDFILNEFKTHSLITDHPPIVAFGKNSGNPHYEIPAGKNGALAQKGDVIQLDMWAKEKACLNDRGILSSTTPVFADISWVGVYDTEILPRYTKAFAKLTQARDVVYQLLSPLAEKQDLYNVSGASLDFAVRKSLIDSGFKDWLRHRTGHGIDQQCHGSGVNLDSIEFPDNRTLLEGSSFSVEPGIYGDEFGMRTEIDMYIQNGKAIISGKLFQKKDGLPVPQTQLLYVSQEL